MNITLDHVKEIVRSAVASATRHKPNLNVTDPDDPRYVVGSDEVAKTHSDITNMKKQLTTLEQYEDETNNLAWDAKNTANSAQTDANNAKSLANTALNTGNSAKTTAESAKTTANTAIKGIGGEFAVKNNSICTNTYIANDYGEGCCLYGRYLDENPSYLAYKNSLKLSASASTYDVKDVVNMRVEPPNSRKGGPTIIFSGFRKYISYTSKSVCLSGVSCIEFESSAPGSTKRFRLVVDDNGNLSTELVEEAIE